MNKLIMFLLSDNGGNEKFFSTANNLQKIIAIISLISCSNKIKKNIRII